jgi:peptide/nickel transport system substrate-binding protein
MIKKVLLAAAVLAGMGAPAWAQKSADTLRVAWRDQIPDIDPYFNSLRTGLIVAHQAWDTLVYRDPADFSFKPLLAKSWKWVDDTTLEFELQPDATFHNGDKVTAADVVYTVGVASDPNAGLAVPSNYSPWLKGAEAIDDLHVRIYLKQAFPAALQYIAFVMPIYPKAYREKVGRDGYRAAPIGAGPYKITKLIGSTEIDMERYEGYYKGSAKGRPPIGKLVIKEVQDAAAEMTALLGNQVDWIWQYNADQYDKIAAVPRLTTMRHESMRVAHLQIDAIGRSDDKSPLKDVRVRKAVWYAIDRKSFADKIIQGGSRVPDAPCYFTQFGCNQDAAVKYPYDPAKAKALLAEAGYKDGFDTEILNSNLPGPWAAKLQNDLGAVGIRARINTMQAGGATTRWMEGKAPMYLSSWGSYSVNDVSAIMPYFFSGRAEDYARDPEVIADLTAGGSVVDPAKRIAAYDKAIHRITDQAYWLPIATYVTVYALDKNLNFTPWADEMPRFFQSSWK